MSDAEKQLDELARITEQLNRELIVYGQISKQTSDQMLDAQVQSATGIKNFSKGMAAGGDAISALAGSAMAAGNLHIIRNRVHRFGCFAIVVNRQKLKTNQLPQKYKQPQ